jgi:hypothetical protein
MQLAGASVQGTLDSVQTAKSPQLMRGPLDSSIDMTRSKKQVPRCPACGSDRCIPIAYGMPGPELQVKVERGEVVLGGCVVWDGQPEWACTACGSEWTGVGSGRR